MYINAKIKDISYVWAASENMGFWQSIRMDEWWLTFTDCLRVKSTCPYNVINIKVTANSQV